MEKLIERCCTCCTTIAPVNNVSKYFWSIYRFVLLQKYKIADIHLLQVHVPLETYANLLLIAIVICSFLVVIFHYYYLLCYINLRFWNNIFPYGPNFYVESHVKQNRRDVQLQKRWINNASQNTSLLYYLKLQYHVILLFCIFISFVTPAQLPSLRGYWLKTFHCT